MGKKGPHGFESQNQWDLATEWLGIEKEEVQVVGGGCRIRS